MPAGFASLDFHDFHRTELPQALGAGRGALAAPAAAPLGPLAFRVKDGDAYTYIPEREQIRIESGDAAAKTVVELDHALWEGLVHDLESAPGLLYGGFAKGLRGDMMDFVRWEPALRAMYQGRPVYQPDAVDLRGRDGTALDPEASFSLDDNDELLADFLRVMGYVRVRNVFSRDEVEALIEDAEVLRAAAVPDDQKSWWGRDEAGEQVLVRVIQAGTRKRLNELYDDPRIQRLGALPDETLVPKNVGSINGATVLWKQFGVVEGLGDLPWHRDCGMGGHAVICPSINCSIHLGPASAESGDLRFLPGSWRSSVGFADGDDASVAHGVSCAAQPGDVTLHYGDVVHAAPPPTSRSGPYRASILIGFGRPNARHHRGETHYNDALFQSGSEVPDMRTMAQRAGTER